MPGIYIHIPFCKKACHYCNFYFSTSLRQKQEVIAALIKEIGMVSEDDSYGEEVSTIYFGGGTPSLLEQQELASIIKLVKEKFKVEENAEITLEANPDDINGWKLEEWKSIGVNRLSIGIQSFFEEDLKWMNRAHDAKQAINCVHLAKAAGFYNFSIDLIYGSPLLTNEQWKKNVDTVIELGVPHISSYALTVEQGTALDVMIRKKKSLPVEQEKQAEQFLQLIDWMEAAGYEHYEISNFAQPGKRSRHNSSYWKGIPYIGIGPSAHSFNGNSRKWNVANNALYTKQIEAGILPAEEEKLTEVQQLNEYIMISLRTMEGIDLEKIKNDFGKERMNGVLNSSKKFIDSGKTIFHEEKLKLTREGKLFADGIAAELFA